MADITFDTFCMDRNCPHLQVWDFDYDDTVAQCWSCDILGQSFNVEEYPTSCVHLADIKQYEKEQLELNTWNTLKNEHL